MIFSKSVNFILKTIGILQLNGLKVMKETFFRPILLPKNVFTPCIIEREEVGNSRVTAAKRKKIVPNLLRFASKK